MEIIFESDAEELGESIKIYNEQIDSEEPIYYNLEITELGNQATISFYDKKLLIKILSNSLLKLMDECEETKDLKEFDITQLFLTEYIRARTLHKPMHSKHEGYAIIKEELDELWDEIKKKEPNKEHLREEIVQIGAMCLAFYKELLEN